jgi:hypothetical protein
VTDQSGEVPPVQRRADFRSRFFTGTPASGRPTVPVPPGLKPPTVPPRFNPPTDPVPLTGNAPAVPPAAPPHGPGDQPPHGPGDQMPFAGRPVSAPPLSVSFANEPTERLPIIKPATKAAGRVQLIYEHQIRKPWRLLVFTVAIVSLTVGVVLGQTEAYQAPKTRPAVAAPAAVAQTPSTLTAPVGEVKQRRLEIAGAATRLRIRTADLGEALYTIAALDQSASPQLAEVDDGTLLTLTAGTTGTVGAEVVLNAKVGWTLKLTGGATELDVDSRAGGLTAVEVAAGVSRGVLQLSKPAGTMPIEVSGSVGELTVRTEAGAPARVRLGKGAGTATINGKARRGVKVGATLREAGWQAASDRYDVRVNADVSTILVERLVPGS